MLHIPGLFALELLGNSVSASHLTIGILGFRGVPLQLAFYEVPGMDLRLGVHGKHFYLLDHLAGF